MKKEDMTSLVSQELSHIPNGELPQKLLRYLYNAVRRNFLASSESSPKEESLLYCIKQVQEKHPDFKPEYDKKFFELSSP